MLSNTDFTSMIGEVGAGLRKGGLEVLLISLEGLKQEGSAQSPCASRYLGRRERLAEGKGR